VGGDKQLTEFSGPLSGIEVLDLTTVFMGPSATQMMGDLGADVIKVEAPGGDATRTIGPNGEYGLGPLFLGLNRNKRSIVVDLKSTAGAELLLELAKSADVLATNIRPAAMDRLGLGHARFAELNSRLVYASMVGFSQKGPYGRKAAYDDMIQAATGLAAVMGQQAGSEPRYMPLTIADRSVALYAFGAIAAALYARTWTGKGQRVEIPMFETMVPYVLGDHLYGHAFIPGSDEFGRPRLMAKNHRPYKTKDGYVCCLIYTDRHWKIFLEAVGKGDLLNTDPRFADIRNRTAHIDELYQLVSEVLEQRTTREWREILPEEEIPIFPMHTLESLLEDEHLAATGFFTEVEHPIVGRIRDTAVPSEWSATVPANQRPVPALGEHTVDVLREAGFAEQHIERLLACNVVFQRPQGG
jgi:crotonobetainyl-CoA:carnitine CoA-transferase CaiB-like acyl-CoA transferase